MQARLAKVAAVMVGGFGVFGYQSAASAALIPFYEGFESYADNATDLSPLTTTVSHGNVTLQVDENASQAYQGDKFLMIGWNSSTGVTGNSLVRVPSTQFRTNNDPMAYTVQYAVNVTGTELNGTTTNVRGNANFAIKDSANATLLAIELYDSIIHAGGTTGAVATGTWMLVTVGIDEVAGTYSVDVINTSNNASLLSVSNKPLGGNGIADNFYVAGGQYPNSAPGALFRYDALSVVPEPGSIGLLGLGILLLTRKNRSGRA